MKRISARQLRNYWPVFLLLIPTFALIGLFSYIPAGSAIYHSFFRWDGDDIKEFVAMENFKEAVNDEELGSAFGLVMIFISANLVKMTPSILIAVLIHRLASNRWRYLYRIAFVLPMIIPAMVWLLIWKYFYEPNFGVLNSVLKGMGLMDGLNWLDQAMPALAGYIAPFNDEIVRPIFRSVWGLGIFGAMVLGMLPSIPHRIGLVGIKKTDHRPVNEVFYAGLGDSISALGRGWMWWVALLAGGYLLMDLPRTIAFMALLMVSSQFVRFASDPDDSRRSASIGLLFFICAGIVVGTYIFFVRSVPFALFGMLIPLLFWASWSSEDAREWVRRSGMFILLFFALLVLTSLTWTDPTDAFRYGRPTWLNNPKLIPTALIFWGFPWVGIVSVLLYLSGLGNIDQSVYEAAEIDGCGWFRKFWNVELPLIMTQIRLNLVLMIIGTLKGWGQVYILLGDTGGPEGAGMLPGLYMFRKAFTDGEAGYGCAIGLLLFFLIVYLTLVNNKYVRVEK
ncbi:MAG: carbohydrate ABC transporter permease [Phycisphaerae bacterium]